MDALTASAEDATWIRVEDASAAGSVRAAATDLGRRLGFSPSRVGEIGIAATELGTNLYRHAKQGVVVVSTGRHNDDAAVELTAMDNGPGMHDLCAAARDGQSSTGTLGIGIGAMRRLSSYFDAHSIPGRGTVMNVTFWSNGQSPGRSPVAGLTRAMQNEFVCGDAWAVRSNDRVTTLLLADGLGHGELAAIASRAAVKRFLAATEDALPATVLRALEGDLKGTRGAAVAVARLQNGRVTFAGIGNVGMWIDDGERRQGLLSTPGIVGSHSRRIREVEGPLPAGAIVVMHSDGLTSKWDLRSYPGLVKHDARIIAATLIRDAGIHHDDASIVVAKT